MLNKLFSIAGIGLTCVFASSLPAGTPEQEKAFLSKYKTAAEAGDSATLESFLYTKDAHPMALEFYKMMLTANAGEKITKIELVDLSPEDTKKAAEVMDGPDGSKTRLPLKATKKLKIETGGGSSSSENFIAEHEGKYVIPVPAAAK